jgi:hypothetical protein
MITKTLITFSFALSTLGLVACSNSDLGGENGGFGSFSSTSNESDKFDENKNGDNDQGVDSGESGDNNDTDSGGNGGNNDGSLGDGGNGAGGLNIGDEEVDTPCKYFDKERSSDHTVSIPGVPLDINVGKYTLSGAGQWDDDQYLIKGKYYEIKGDFYASLDDAPQRSVPFKTHRFNAIIDKARSADCEVTAEDGSKSDDFRKGCFIKGTKILMSNQTWKAVEDVKKEDMVWNPILNKAQKVFAIIHGPEADKHMWTVGYKGKQTTVTQNHPFMTQSGMKVASKLTKADKILVGKNRYEQVTTLKKNDLDPNAYVHNFKVMGNHGEAQEHMVMADGVVSGDLYLQQQLEEQSKRSNVMSLLSKVQ